MFLRPPTAVWSRKSLLYRPTPIKPPYKGLDGYVHFFCPLIGRLGFSAKRKLHGVLINALVGVLLLARCPTKVVGCIGAVIVWVAVKGAAFWPFTNILNKRPEIVPAFADVDTPATVVVIIRDARVLAPLVHKIPSSIERVVGSTVYNLASHVASFSGHAVKGSGVGAPDALNYTGASS